MKLVVIAIIILLVLIVVSILHPESNSIYPGWEVRYKKNLAWHPYTVYYFGEFVEGFDSLEEAKTFIHDQKEDSSDESEEDVEIVYREK